MAGLSKQLWLVCVLLSPICSLVATAADAERMMFIRCEPPRGPAIDFGWLHSLTGKTLQSPDDGFKLSQDGVTGVYPTFFMTADEPGVLWSLWGSTVPPGMTKERVEELSPTEPHKGTIIKRSDRLLASIEVYESEVWLQTFYLKLGVAYFTRHKLFRGFSGGSDGMAMGSLLKSTCKASYQ